MTAQPGSHERDLIVLGGGCAGLSLAARLVQQLPGIALTVVEPRSDYEEDRTWCGWQTAPHFFSDCVAGQWNRWRVATAGRELLLDSPNYPYELVRADRVYRKARSLMEGCGSAQLLLGARAQSVTEFPDHVQVVLQDGTALRSPWVVDTRPQQRTLGRPWLWQNFVGYVVHSESLELNQQAVPTLMEFQQARGSVAQFLYTVPFAVNEVLFECTRFSRVRGEEVLVEAELVAWLQQRFAGAWTIVRRESGSLPMAPPLPVKPGRVVQAGTRGGSMRVSTGYAFHRIQRWADACAQSWLEAGVPVAPPVSPLLQTMDELFLRVLQQPDTTAADIFIDMFETCPPDNLIRFLSGVPRPSDFWPVASGLPWGKFLREMPNLFRMQSGLPQDRS